MSIFLLVGHQEQQSISNKLLDEVERTIEINPNSASNIQNSFRQSIISSSVTRTNYIIGANVA